MSTVLGSPPDLTSTVGERGSPMSTASSSSTFTVAFFLREVEATAGAEVAD